MEKLTIFRSKRKQKRQWLPRRPNWPDAQLYKQRKRPGERLSKSLPPLGATRTLIRSPPANGCAIASLSPAHRFQVDSIEGRELLVCFSVQRLRKWPRPLQIG